MRLHLTKLLAISGALLSGCGGDVTRPSLNPDPAPNDRAPVMTGASLYTLTPTENGWTGEIDFEVTNGTDRKISLLNCRGGYGLKLEKWEGSDWVTAWSPALLMCLGPPIEILPGQARQDVVRIFGGHRRSSFYPQFTVDEIDGTYRLVIEGAFWAYDHGGPPWGESVPLEHRVSNTFEIRTR